MAKQAVNDQTNKELQNQAQYLTFADALEFATYPGFARRMRHAASEELTHYEHFARYMIDRGWEVTHKALETPQAISGENPLELFKAALALELENTMSILALHDMAETEGDGQTCAFLMEWAIKEQTDSVRDLTDRVREIGRQDAAGLLLLDREYGK